MFNSYFFAKFAVLVVGLAVSPAFSDFQTFLSTHSREAGEHTSPKLVAHRVKSQLQRLKTARVQAQALELAAQNRDMQRLISEAAAEHKVASIAIADLKTKVARAEATAFAKYQDEVDAMSHRLQEYISQSDANVAAMKSGLEGLQAGLNQAQHQSRVAVARGIVKRRHDRARERTIAELKLELSKTQEHLRLAKAAPAPSVVAAQAPPAAPPAAALPGTAAAKSTTPMTAPTAIAAAGTPVAEKPKVKRKPVRQTESSGFSFFP